jgi:hypothetical protein
MTQDSLTMPTQSLPVPVRSERSFEPAPPATAKAFGKALAKAAKERRDADGVTAVFTTGKSGDFAQLMSPGAGSAGPDLSAAAHLDRIAAAIAEASAAGSDAKLHLTLPPGHLPIAGAILGRDGGGQMTVMLLAQGHVAPAVAAGLATELSARLSRRQIKTSRIAFEKADRRLASDGS